MHTCGSPIKWALNEAVRLCRYSTYVAKMHNLLVPCDEKYYGSRGAVMITVLERRTNYRYRISLATMLDI